MTTSSVAYQANRKRVAAKVMDGEAVIIDLVSGTYYSLRDTGGRIWQLLESGLPQDAIAAVIARDYGIHIDRASADLEMLLTELAAEQLVVPSPDGGPGAGGDPPPQAEVSEYTAPELQIYRDMQELLALDPPMPGLQDIPWEP